MPSTSQSPIRAFAHVYLPRSPAQLSTSAMEVKPDASFSHVTVGMLHFTGNTAMACVSGGPLPQDTLGRYQDLLNTGLFRNETSSERALVR